MDCRKETDQKGMNKAHNFKRNLEAVDGVALFVTTFGIVRCAHVSASTCLMTSEV